MPYDIRTPGRRWWFSILVNAGVGILIYLLLTPSFESYDDIKMISILRGTGEVVQPDEHILFSHIGIGILFKNLYQQAPGVYWYEGFQTLLIFVFHIVLLHVLLSVSGIKKGLLLFGSYMLLFGVHALIRLQFTTVSVIAALTGVLFVFLYLKSESIWPKRIHMVLGFLFFLLSYAIRSQSFLLLALLMAPVVVMFYKRIVHTKTQLASLLLLGSLLIIGLSALSLFNNAYYARDPAWNDFWNRNRLQAKFCDMSLIRYNKDVCDAVGWSENDFRLARTNFYCDTVLFSKGRMQYVADHNTLGIETLDEMKPNLSAWPLLFGGYKFLYFSLLACVLLALVVVKIPLADGLKLLACALVLLGINMALLALRGPLERLLFSTSLVYITLLLLYVGQTELRMKFQWLVISAAGLLCVVNFYKEYTFSSDRVQRYEELNKPEVIEELSAKKLVVFGCDLNSQWYYLPFHTNPLYHSLHYITVSWISVTPIWYKECEHWGFRYFSMDILTDPSVTLVSNSYGVYAYYLKYMEEHYGVQRVPEKEYEYKPLLLTFRTFAPVVK